MAGFKGRLKESIRARLAFTLSLAILCVALAAGVFSFFSAFDETHELQDDVLRQIADLLGREPSLPSYWQGGTKMPDNDEQSRVIVRAFNGDKTAEKAFPLPSLPDGLHTLAVNNEGFRVMFKTLPGGGRIAVAQSVALRNEAARDSALRAVMPFLILLPVLLLLVANIVRKMFKPITSLSGEIDLREGRELYPVSEEHLPVEIRPFIVAINRLLGRVERVMGEQRRFIADAAHELRSPMTALSLQAERLSGAEMSAAARERLFVLRRGIERGRKLLEQLLAFSRAQLTPEQHAYPISVPHIYRLVLEELMPFAEAKRIDIGMESGDDVSLCVNESDLLILVGNLVDNAVRYTPERGRIDLSVTKDGGKILLEVRDSGPGIPVSERERVFAPFYRIPGSGESGSGLGLSIVKSIADRWGAKVHLDFAREAPPYGLKVIVLIPGG